MKRLLSHSATGEFDSPPEYLRTPHVRVEPYKKPANRRPNVGRVARLLGVALRLFALSGRARNSLGNVERALNDPAPPTRYTADGKPIVVVPSSREGEPEGGSGNNLNASRAVVRDPGRVMDGQAGGAATTTRTNGGKGRDEVPDKPRAEYSSDEDDDDNATAAAAAAAASKKEEDQRRRREEKKEKKEKKDRETEEREEKEEKEEKEREAEEREEEEKDERRDREMEEAEKEEEEKDDVESLPDDHEGEHDDTQKTQSNDEEKREECKCLMQ
eukprot:1188507-Prorocentrum_minimum.AAC.4